MSSNDPICQRCGEIYLLKNKTNICPKCLEGRFLERGVEIKKLETNAAALREENDLQRDSIQQLSAQAAGLREALSVIRNNPDLWKRPKIGGQDKYAGMPPLVRKIDSILAQPDPGAEIRERMAKLEAVAAKARKYMDEEDCPSGYIASCRYTPDECGAKVCPQGELWNALAAYEGS